MKKIDRLKQSAGNVSESMGANFDPATAAIQVPASTVKSEYQGVTKLKNAAAIEVAKIRRDENQPREHFDEESLARLAASLKTKGQLQPIQVRWDKDLDSYVLIAGERRWRAAQLAGIPTVTAVIHEGAIDADELLEIQLIENMLRDDLQPIEQAKAYKRVMDRRGWSGNQLAKELNLNQSWVSQKLKLLELPETVQEKVDDGTLSQSAAYEISKLEDPQEQVEVARQVIAGNVGSKGAREVVRSRRAATSTGGGGRKPAPGRMEFRRGPFVFTVQGPIDDADALWDAWNSIGQSRGDANAA